MNRLVFDGGISFGLWRVSSHLADRWIEVRVRNFGPLM
jgi:hypothetical protein